MAGEPLRQLPPDKIAELIEAKRQLNEALALVARATACGYDCRHQQAMIDHYAPVVDATLYHFGGRRNDA